MIHRYFCISSSWLSSSWRALTLGTKSAPTPEDAFVVSHSQSLTKIIIGDAPRFARKTFSGLSQHQRKFSNVACEHHFVCLGVTCTVNASADHGPLQSADHS
jgi:hypothetical protein